MRPDLQLETRRASSATAHVSQTIEEMVNLQFIDHASRKDFRPLVPGMAGIFGCVWMDTNTE
jgi:hypothetical protein